MTTATRVTPAGRGAIAVIEVVGPIESLPFRPANGRPWSEQPIGRLLYGQWEGEDVVVCRVGENRCEIHCHGGDAAVARILVDLERGGITSDSRPPMSLPTELRAALSQTVTARTADLLNEQLEGINGVPCLQLWASRLLGLLSPGGGDEGTGQEAWLRRIEAIDSLLAWAEFGRHLTEPWRVVLTGRPNVGKSSLINALLGFERAIVAEQPGTTRDIVTAVTAFDGWPVQLSDTAGQRDTASDLEAAGIERARTALRVADIQIIVLDIGEPPTDADRDLLTEWPDAIVVAHKCDRADQWGTALPVGALRVSSLTGAGLDELQHELVSRLVPSVPPPGTAIPVTPRQVDVLRRLRAACAAEDDAACRKLLREQVL